MTQQPKQDPKVKKKKGMDKLLKQQHEKRRTLLWILRE